ncbi:uncharacterized protein, partial [Sinocyclocheilus grahami]|uniref:uncharacterized protein n=1 Tax=Sinocyclocheilus grahami TaxID=75366 RepID=UPI0007AD3D37
MRFEGKYKFFKQVICDTKNFKNVPQTLAVHHQRLLAYNIDSPSFLKPSIQTKKVMGTVISTFPENIQEFLRQTNAVQNTVLTASSVSIDGIQYNPDMTVDSLSEQLEEKLGLQYKFTLQFEDPDFNNSLVNLTNIADLPDKPTLKIVSLVTTPTPSTADTEVLSVASDEHSRHSLQTAWPEAFEIPTFPVDVEYGLLQGNLQYMRDQTYLQLSGELKHEILEKLSETIYSYKAYPDKENSEAVAAALIIKHPCLTQPGSSNGWNGWYDSLRWKMGNYRSKLRQTGCLEVSINGGKRRGQQPQRNIKRPKRFEINCLPNFPDGEDEASMESKRKEMVEDMKKRRLNAALIAQNMNSTFAL